MHIKIKDLHAGSWLMSGKDYAVFIDIADDGLAEIVLNGHTASIMVEITQLRPVFLNRFVLEQCGFKPKRNIYTDSLFEITVGDASSLYKITGHRIRKPFATYLLSQLHIFQNIYREETGAELTFTPPVI